MKKILFPIVGLLVLVFAVYQSYQMGWWRFQNPKFGIRGIDVSHHQGSIDWHKVSADNVHFAYIKATEGGDYHDAQFASNWRNAADAGIKRGAYHFYSLCSGAGTQDGNFASVVANDEAALPPMIDLEFSEGCNSRPVPPAACDDIKHLVQKFETRYKKQVVLYTTRDFFAMYGSCLPKRKTWGRSLYRQGDVSWTFWQFANRGRVNGIAGPVDLDIFQGDNTAFTTFANSSLSR